MLAALTSAVQLQPLCCAALWCAASAAGPCSGVWSPSPLESSTATHRCTARCCEGQLCCVASLAQAGAQTPRWRARRPRPACWGCPLTLCSTPATVAARFVAVPGFTGRRSASVWAPACMWDVQLLYQIATGPHPPTHPTGSHPPSCMPAAPQVQDMFFSVAHMTRPPHHLFHPYLLAGVHTLAALSLRGGCSEAAAGRGAVTAACTPCQAVRHGSSPSDLPLALPDSSQLSSPHLLQATGQMLRDLKQRWWPAAAAAPSPASRGAADAAGGAAHAKAA